MTKGWKKLSSRIIHENKWYSLREDDVICPNGKKGKYYVVDVNSIAVIAEDRDKKIYLVGQTRYPIGNIYSWEIINGGSKPDKDPLEVAKRELEEETGILADKWISLGYIHPETGYSSEKTNVYLARELKKTKRSPDSTEDITVKKVRPEQIIKMIKNNKITCGITIAAMYKYLLLR